MSPISQLMLAAAFAAGVIVTSLSMSAYDRFIDDPAVARAARSEGLVEGVASERRAWQELRDRAEIEEARKLALAQEKISAADRALADYRARDRQRADAIRRAYEERIDDDATADQPGCDCSRYALPDRVWNELR